MVKDNRAKQQEGRTNGSFPFAQISPAVFDLCGGSRVLVHFRFPPLFMSSTPK